MTDEQDEPTLHAEQEAQIRALLADAGSAAGPTPPEVVTRLDDTLARLRAERAAEAPGTPADPADDPAPDATVVPLRRWFPRVAVAAAAVLVIGGGAVSAAQLGLLDGSGDSASESTAGGAVSDQDAQSGSGSESGDTSDSESAPSEGTSPDASALLSPDTAVVRRWPAVSAASFADDVTTLLRDGADRRTLDSTSGTTPEAEPPPSSSAGDGQSARESAQALRARQCPGPPVDDGSATSPVRYDETPAALVVHPVSDGTRLVEAWTCAGDRLLDSTRVPAEASGP